jgi:hypothetical protein
MIVREFHGEMNSYVSKARYYEEESSLSRFFSGSGRWATRLADL